MSWTYQFFASVFRAHCDLKWMANDQNINSSFQHARFLRRNPTEKNIWNKRQTAEKQMGTIRM